MLIFAASLAIFVYGMIASMLGTILYELSDRFRLSPSQNGTIAFVQALGLIIASIMVGPLLDSQGKKVGLVLGLAVIGTALFALPNVRNFHTILVSLFLLGLGGGVVVTASNALASDVGDAHRATALNFVNLFFGIGGFATPFLFANVFKKNWPRLCYMVAGLTTVTLIIEAAAAIPAPLPGQHFVLSDVRGVLAQPLLYLLGFFLFLYIGCEVGVWNWLVRHLVAQGVSEGRALNILSVGFALGLLIGRIGILPVLINVPPIAVTLVGSLAMAVTTFLMLQTSKPTWAFVLVFLSGLSMAPVFPTTIAIVGGAFPRMTGTAIGFVVTCGWTGLAVSSAVIGAIAGGDARGLKKALLVIPGSAVLLVGLDLAIKAMLHF